MGLNGAISPQMLGGPVIPGGGLFGGAGGLMPYGGIGGYPMGGGDPLSSILAGLGGMLPFGLGGGMGGGLNLPLIGNPMSMVGGALSNPIGTAMNAVTSPFKMLGSVFGSIF